MIEIIKGMRSKMFPEIPNWKSEQNHLRNANPNDLNFYQFLWFHPNAYTFLKIGVPSIFMILSFVFSLKYVKFGLYSPAFFIPLIGVIFCLIWIFREIGRIDIHLRTNMYDILMKD